MISFAVKRNIFYNFFGFKKNNLNRQLRFGNLRDIIFKDKNNNKAIDNVVYSDQNEEVKEVIREPENPEP